MSLLKSNSVQIGQSATATQNFTLSVPSSPDGTIKLARGNSGATTADVLTVNASGAITGATISGAIINSSTVNGGSITSGTALAYNWNGLTTNTSLDFTGIPSWVKRITISVFNISYNGSDNGLIQLGVGSTPTTSGYNSVSNFLYGGNSSGQTSSTSGFIWYDLTSSYAMFGTYVFTKHSGNTWIGSSLISNNTGVNFSIISNGYITLSGDLGMVRVLGSLGGALDGGSINIMYEG